MCSVCKSSSIIHHHRPSPFIICAVCVCVCACGHHRVCACVNTSSSSSPPSCGVCGVYVRKISFHHFREHIIIVKRRGLSSFTTIIILHHHSSYRHIFHSFIIIIIITIIISSRHLPSSSSSHRYHHITYHHVIIHHRGNIYHCVWGRLPSSWGNVITIGVIISFIIVHIAYLHHHSLSISSSSFSFIPSTPPSTPSPSSFITITIDHPGVARRVRGAVRCVAHHHPSIACACVTSSPSTCGVCVWQCGQRCVCVCV